ncbi:MAG: DMT family transporter [Candidatus Thiodiazotropha sp. (ex Myrtea spinifera)]|nr:DMT family transporter [Candidatus Thiodiazotropha sp. (ex Myrtea spinifera)]
MKITPLFLHDRHVLFAILSTIMAGFILAAMDGLAKWLMHELPTEQVVWARYFFHTLIVGIVFAVHSGVGFMKPQRPLLQTVRAISLLCVTFCMYYSIRTISLADATAIIFFAPVLVTLLAGIFLNERVGIQEWLAVSMGFAGVLWIVRPGFREIQPAMLLALLAAVSLSFYFVLTRALRGKDSEKTTLFHTTAMGAVLLTLLMPLWWVAPTPEQWGYLIMTGAMGATGHFLLVKAFHLAPAPVLSPFLNAQLVAAVLYSVLFFDDRLDAGFFIGVTLIVGAGLIVWAHQQVMASRVRRRLETK